MKDHRIATISIIGALLLCVTAPAPAQDLGPYVKKLADGVYVYSKEYESNVGIILTQDGVVLIDAGQNPSESVVVMDLVKKLTPQPVRYVIQTEPHSDHTSGTFVFSPPAAVIAASGAGALIAENRLSANVPGARNVLPHIEYGDKMTLRLGGRTVELLNLENVHSGADTGVWLPNERVLFAAATVVVKRYSNIRPFVTIPDILAGITQMRALAPEVVVPGHGAPGTMKIFDDMERYFALLVERVRSLAGEGKTLEQVKAELRMPENADWLRPEAFPSNVDAAWRVVKGEN
jgi:cyclase